MNLQRNIKPVNIFFLVQPAGISQGFVSVALPFILTHNGFTVAQTAAIVAIGFSANLWRFVWGPVVDIWLSLKKWYWIGLIACIASLLLLCYTATTVKDVALLSAIVFVSQVAGTFTLLPVNGFMAKSISEKDKGKASGWYQAGCLAGTGLGGGAGLWLSTHYNILISGYALSAASIFCALLMLWMKDVHSNNEKTFIQEISGMGKDIFAMLKVPVTLYVIFLLAMPIGTGAAANLWSAIAQDWKTNSDTVALVTGILSGLVSAVGCIAGGYFIDRWGVWFAYLGSGIVCALVTIIMAVMPMQPVVYISGVLTYTFGIGLINAAFTAVILFAIGKKHVVTKYALLASLGNLPVVYMTAVDGWAHDKFNSKFMLVAEAAIGILAVMIFIFILKTMMRKKLIPVSID